MALRSVRALGRSHRLNLVQQFFAGDTFAFLNVLHALMNLVDHVEPVHNLVKIHGIGQAGNGFNGFLFGGVLVHGSLLSHCSSRRQAA